MGIITNIIGEQKFENFKLSAGQNSMGNQLSSQESIKAHKPLYKFENLEMAYRSDSLTFNAINKSVQMIMAKGFKSFIHEKKYIITQFKKFFENIGEIGEDITFEELLESIFSDQMVYGNSFVEKIFDKTDTKIVDLSKIDPKRIDYAKKSDGSIILDSQRGKPIGYMLKLDSYSPFSEGDEIPKEYQDIVSKDGKSVFLLAKRICHFKLYTIGDGFYGIGLIEPAYKSAIYKKNMQKAKANFVYLNGFPSPFAYVGNDRKMATPSDIKAVNKQISTMDYQRNFTFPEWVKVEYPKFNESKLSSESIKDMSIDQISALSVPDAVASGQGQTANKQTLGEQMKLWEDTLKDVIKKTMSSFKKYILKPINETNNFGGVPDIEWSELRAEDVEKTITQIIRLLTAKSIHATPEFVVDLEEDLRDLMNIKVSGKKPKKIDPQLINNDKNNVGNPNIQLPEPKDKKQPQQIRELSKYPVEYIEVVGASVEHAKQIMYNKFLESDCTHFFNVDADIFFLNQKENPIDVLIEANKEIVGGIYVYKREPCLPSHRPLDLQEIYERDGKFPKDYKFIIPNILHEVKWLAGGCMMIKKEVIEKLTKEFLVPNLPMIYKKEYLSEDFAFCQRCIEKDYKIYAEPKILLGHQGSYFFTLSDYKI